MMCKTLFFSSHIMLRDLVTQKSVDQKTVTDFRYPRACRFRKYQIENLSILVNFGQFWPILAKFYEFKSRFEKSW
jgi:hypothetical protein